MMLLAAVHSVAGTFHRAAAAAISIIRAAAPALRTYSFDSRMPRLPPVEKLPHTVARDVLAGGRIVGRYFRPVACQFLGDELSETSQGPLPHLRAGDAYHHRIVGLDHNPGVDLKRSVLRQRFR